MGREIKRVPLDFEWPESMIWKGYWNPYSGMPCKECDKSGYSPEAKELSDTWYSYLRTDGEEGWMHHLTQDEVDALVEAGRLMEFTHVPINEEQVKIVEEKVANGGNSWLPEPNGYKPTAEEVNKWSYKGFGHDSINQHICLKQRLKRRGIDEIECKWCKGRGYIYPTPEFHKLAEEWERIDPPEGEGYQLWTTTTEGSPMSPVFKTPEELARHLADTGASAFGSSTASYEDWLGMIHAQWSPSMVRQGDEIKSGVEFVGQDTEEE